MPQTGTLTLYLNLFQFHDHVITKCVFKVFSLMFYFLASLTELNCFLKEYIQPILSSEKLKCDNLFDLLCY